MAVQLVHTRTIDCSGLSHDPQVPSPAISPVLAAGAYGVPASAGGIIRKKKKAKKAKKAKKKIQIVVTDNLPKSKIL